MRPPRSELRKDRLAAVVIRTAGISVIVVVLAIVVSIAAQALPLFRPATVGPVIDIADVEPIAIGTSRPSGSVWWLESSGRLATTHGSRVLRSDPIADGAAVLAADNGAGGALSVLTADHRLVVRRVSVTSGRGSAKTEPGFRGSVLAAVDERDLPPDAIGCTAAVDPVGDVAAAAWSSHEVRLWIWRSGLRSGEAVRLATGNVARVAVADNLALMAVITTGGGLFLYRVADLEPVAVDTDLAPVVTARFLAGGRSLAIAGKDGSVEVLIETPRAEVTNRRAVPVDLDSVGIEPGGRTIVPDTESVAAWARREGVEVRRVGPIWRAIHRFAPRTGAPTALATVPRGRTFAVGDSTGRVALYNATSGTVLVDRGWSTAPVTALALSWRGDLAVAAAGGRLLQRSVDARHPEISLETLFLPVWYEGYAEPRSIWQTSGGADDFQPKFGLLPLLVGTVKATLYAMMISVPLALLAALYVSQLAPGWLQSVVKPAVEMMAAVPTVVVGFLAALWLAPRLELCLFPVLAATAALLPAIFIALGVWRLVPSDLRRRAPEGAELAALVACLVAVCGGAFAAAGWLEARLFDGGFPQALFDVFGVQYEQRNGLVIGVALGFAVIPVIFTIAEDACSSVPSSQVLAARALGASRWQAAVRLVAPAAAPGMAAAVMLGLGRALGETMIVLMAAGNTPILDLSAFNGMRTMSAAIAFEMPEAAVGSTLFRVLFLAGFLLFVLCLVFTTVAELVGRRLRKRYARL
ncbi:MAG: ABC transporter permease subunit [Holophagae bacterium]|jgi:phosphate transport system permease protein